MTCGRLAGFKEYLPFAVISTVMVVASLLFLRSPLIAYGLLAPFPGPAIDVPTICLLPLTAFSLWWAMERPVRVPPLQEPSQVVRVGYKVVVGVVVAALLPAFARGAMTYAHGQPGFDAACGGGPSVNNHGSITCITVAQYGEYLAGAIGLFNAIPALILVGFVSALVVALLNRARA